MSITIEQARAMGIVSDDDGADQETAEKVDALAVRVASAGPPPDGHMADLFARLSAAKPFVPRPDWLVERYGYDVGTFLRAKMDEAQKGCMHVSNERACEITRPSEVTEYEQEKAAGCCGSCDLTMRHPSGRVFAIGFNYGH